jgi:hypothetical protein
MVDVSLLEAFEAKGTALLSASSLTGFWRLERRAQNVNFKIGAASTGGFDLGAKCETYGLYPWAGGWRGTPWEPADWTVDQLCEEYFGLVRMLLSRDARLRLKYRHNRLQAAAVELRTSDGWQVFEKERRLVLPVGAAREVLLQNDHLPPRFPFTGLQKGQAGVYLWPNPEGA